MSQTDGATGSPRARPKTIKPASLFKTLDPAALSFRLAEDNAPVYSGNTSNPGNELMLAAISSSLSLPGFWLEWPAMWFNICESAFATQNITFPVTKYHHFVGELPAETVVMVEDVVNNG